MQFKKKNHGRVNIYKINLEVTVVKIKDVFNKYLKTDKLLSHPNFVAWHIFPPHYNYNYNYHILKPSCGQSVFKCPSQDSSQSLIQ